MHYYITMAKVGQVACKTNWFAYTDYMVNPKWIGRWVSSEKMTASTASQDYIPY